LGGGKNVVFVHKKCGQSPDLVKIIGKQTINTLKKRPNGNYRLEIIFDRGSEISGHEYICDKCDTPLMEEEIVELLKKIYIPEEQENSYNTAS
jgi:hypothetical protein